MLNLPDHPSAYQPDNSFAQPPRNPPAHLQHHLHNHSPNPETKDSFLVCLLMYVIVRMLYICSVSIVYIIM